MKKILTEKQNDKIEEIQFEKIESEIDKLNKEELTEKELKDKEIIENDKKKSFSIVTWILALKKQ